MPNPSPPYPQHLSAPAKSIADLPVCPPLSAGERVFLGLVLWASLWVTVWASGYVVWRLAVAVLR